MANEWPTIKLGDLGTVITGRTPPGTLPEFFGEVMPFITPTDMDGRRKVGKTIRSLSESGVAALRRVVFQRGISVSCIGFQMGKAMLVDRPAATNQQINTLVPKADRANDLFVYYALSARRDEIFKLGAGGSRTPILNKSGFESLTINLPPLPAQRSIAHILGTLDDKIELNRRMNATLEAMARALFQSWFVDFDPVRAKAAGQSPAGMDPTTAALFPSKFEDSELGEIPKGWRVKVTGDFVERLPVGQKYEQKTVLPMGTVPVLDQGKTGIIGYHNNLPGVQASPDEPVAVFANHTCYMRLIPFPFSAIQNVLPFVGKDVSTLWAYYASEGKVRFSEYKGHWPDFVIQKMVVPAPEITELFALNVKPAISLIWKNEKQSRNLIALRDTLLPKLLKGDLTLRGTETGSREEVP